MANENILGNRLAELRSDKNWNQAKLGRQLGVSRSHISRIESGETKNVSGELLVKIAKLFKVSTDYLLGITREPSPMNHDMSKLGLSVEAVRQILRGQLNMEVFNQMVAHKQFPELLRLMNDYLIGSMTQGILDRNDLLAKGVAALRGIRSTSDEQHDEIPQTIRYINNQKMLPNEVELKAVNATWSSMLKDMKKNWRVEKADDAPVMNLADAIEGIQATLPEKPKGELTQEDIIHAMLMFMQPSMNLTEDGSMHFKALAEEVLQTTSRVPGAPSK